MTTMTESTERTTTRVPPGMINAARERFPEVAGMSASKVLRYCLALALGESRENALRATADARTLRGYAAPPDESGGSVVQGDASAGLMAEARAGLCLDVPCPRCGAAYDNPCHTTGGRYSLPHAEREHASNNPAT